MLFYASLFVLCFASACVLLWVFRSLKSVGQAVYRAFLPSHKGNVRVEQFMRLSDQLASTRTPWGWGSSESRIETKARKGSTQAAVEIPVPWGWRGNRSNKLRSPASTIIGRSRDATLTTDSLKKNTEPLGVSGTSDSQVLVGWPYREESFDFAGSSYRYTRNTEARKSETSFVPRPWGW